MRKQLLLSTGTICLMLASGYALAQAPGERRDEPKRTEQPAGEPRGAASQTQRAQEPTRQEPSKQESAKGAQERAQGQAREERTKGAGREGKGAPPAAAQTNRPSTSTERGQPAKQNEQAQESRRGNREAESAKDRERSRTDAEMKRERGEKSGAQKSTAESDKSKGGTEPTKSGRQGPAATQSERDQRGEPSRSSADQQGAPQQDKRPATATETTRQPAGTNAQNVPSGTSTSQTQINQQARISPDKQVRISETISRQRLAAPERNLNISIRVGEQIPRRVRLHRLPPEIVSIEPAYRGYDYFATEEDIVIVEPRTHRIVSQIPRDPSRARAELRGGGAMAAANTAGGGSPCRIMQRDASGNVAEVSATTVGSTARQDSISVTVHTPDGGSSQPIALGAPAGDIVVATQGQGDCTITIEPQTR